MVVLITKQNIPFFEEFDKKLKFEESTKNTCTFKISDKKFMELRNHIREKGLNPYALMMW